MPARTSSSTYLYALVAAVLVGVGLLSAPGIDPAHAQPAAGGGPTVQFVGNTAVSSGQLRAAIAEHPVFDDTGAIDPDALEHDLLLIMALYWDRGHAQVKVGAPVIPASRDAVTIPIEEGPVFRMGAITVTGELIGSAKANLAKLRVRPRHLFSRSLIAADIQALTDFYQDQGYAYVNVLPLTKVDLQRRTIGLTIEITRGKLASFERIEIYGNSKTPTHAIQRALKITEGAPFTNTDLVEGKRRLLALGFDDVVFSIRHGSSEELVVLTVEVTE
jgi:outer membrane protein insertion porin family